MADLPEIRIGTAEREQALAQLGDHFSDGRLTVTEFDERSAVIAAATTRGQLDQVFADLPTTAVPAATAPAPAERRFQPDWSGRLMAVIPIAALILFFVTGSWLWFLAVPAAGALLFGTDRERKERRRRDRRNDREDRD
ncbi:hypothetical protein BTZ20_1792 [Rhodococcus sp. MTM3W5.2]|uniref:DUF1707 SHOCT-like domain-containing protein n=1 Tax=Rhodococcus sp. MTM3W5.2 TaxID=1805827 RepID=UPI00097935D3|nr:DUF1707 domain-containing protein [Rhodococcus sp. MTM3W5.2]AQA22039.1 hypothetical protein BTZ20_1792 [Rhodococcus sp. MTM3W5.2]